MDKFVFLNGWDEKPESRQSTANVPVAIDRLQTPSLLGINPNKTHFKQVETEKIDNVRGYNLLSMPSPSPNS